MVHVENITILKISQNPSIILKYLKAISLFAFQIGKKATLNPKFMVGFTRLVTQAALEHQFRLQCKAKFEEHTFVLAGTCDGIYWHNAIPKI